MCHRLLVLLLFPLMVIAAPEKLKNGDFKEGLEDWEFGYAQEYRDKIQEARWVPGAVPAVIVEVPHPSAYAYVRLKQDVTLEEEKIYRLTFEVRGELKSGDLRVVYGQRPETASWKNLGLNAKMPVTKDWTEVEVVFTAGSIVSGKDPIFAFTYGMAEGQTEVRNVSIKGPISGVPAPRKAGTVSIGGGKAPAVAQPAVEAATAKADGAGRTWTDIKGRKVEGVYKGYEKGLVLIQPAAGKTLRVKLSVLSDADKAFVKQQEFGE